MNTVMASLKHEHAKCMVSHLLSAGASLSHFLSLCVVLLRDCAAGRGLQSFLLRISANRRC